MALLSLLLAWVHKQSGNLANFYHRIRKSELAAIVWTLEKPIVLGFLGWLDRRVLPVVWVDVGRVFWLFHRFVSHRNRQAELFQLASVSITLSVRHACGCSISEIVAKLVLELVRLQVNRIWCDLGHVKKLLKLSLRLASKLYKLYLEQLVNVKGIRFFPRETSIKSLNVVVHDVV